MKSIAVLQARTNSSRLPGKVLLPLGGLPLVVLAARRASNTGRKVIVATSEEATDETLVDILQEYGIPSYRGSLDNTLQRIVDALSAFSDDTLVFRLTADNTLPDGYLLDEMEAYFRENDLRYLAANGPNTGLPYGVSAELLYLGDLRESAQLTQDSHDQEHVTPFIRRKYGDRQLTDNAAVNMAHYRATIDTFDDYIAMQYVYKGVVDPVNATLEELLERLKNAPFQPTSESPATKLVLGTVQLGLEYGINNTTGKPDQATATAVIKQAISNGMTILDTARSYGDSERVIGRALAHGWKSRAKVITKLATLDDCPDDAGPSTVAAFVDASVFRSCAELGAQNLDVLMLHRASHLKAWNGAAWQRLRRLYEEGVIQALGVSVQNPEELELCLNEPSVTYVQMPFNILDWRWDEIIASIRKEKSLRTLVIHTRSAFLQGLLLSRNEDLWARAGVDDAEEVFSWLRGVEELEGVKSAAQVALGYCVLQDWIDGVVIGVDTEAQLRANLAVLDDLSCVEVQLNGIIERRPELNSDVLNPATWKPQVVNNEQSI